MSAYWNLSDFCPWLNRVWDCWDEDHKVSVSSLCIRGPCCQSKCQFHPPVSRVHTVNLKLWLLMCTLVTWMRSYFLDSKPLSTTCLFSYHNFATCNAGDPGLIPGSGRSAGEGISCPLQYSWASLVAQETWVGKIPWRRLPIPVFWPGEFRELYS